MAKERLLIRGRPIRNPVARKAIEHTGAGPHEPKTAYRRDRCPGCNAQLNQDSLCDTCDLNPWSQEWGSEPNESDWD